jgi:hypothetical protein
MTHPDVPTLMQRGRDVEFLKRLRALPPVRELAEAEAAWPGLLPTSGAIDRILQRLDDQEREIRELQRTIRERGVLLPD